jgi:hypothetical protein
MALAESSAICLGGTSARRIEDFDGYYARCVDPNEL